MVKLKIEFDGWRLLSKQQQNEILKIARNNFQNANFFENGLLIEDFDQMKILKFCSDIINSFKKTFNNWDGFKIQKMSTKISLNYNDRKRKLNFDYFKKLVLEHDLNESKLIIAGLLYMEPEVIKNKLIDLEYETGCLFRMMNDSQIKKTYNSLLFYSAYVGRKIDD